MDCNNLLPKQERQSSVESSDESIDEKTYMTLNNVSDGASYDVYGSAYACSFSGACSYRQEQNTFTASNFSQRDDHKPYTSCIYQLPPINGRRIKGEVMSLWARTQQLPPDYLKQIETFYNNTFPIEVRHYFAEWIESQPWSQIDENNSQHETYAIALLTNLLELIQSKSNELPVTGDFFLLKLKFQNIIDSLRDKYEAAPLGLVRVVKSCLNQEEYLYQQSQNPMQVVDDPMIQQLSNNKQITSEIETLLQLTAETDADIKQLQEKQEALIINWKNSPQIQANYSRNISQINQKKEFVETQIQQEQQGGGDNHANLEKLRNEKSDLMRKEQELTNQKNSYQSDLQTKAQEVLTLRVGLLTKYQKNFQMLDETQKKVIDIELINWKKKQQLAGNGAPMDASLLDTLQTWSESLAEIIWKSRQQIIQFEILKSQLPLNTPADDQNNSLAELSQKITGLLSSLVTSTFVVEQQPPQVLKKESRFTAKIRLLVGGKLNINMNPPIVRSSIISEEQARGLLKKDMNAKDQKDSESGDILNKEGTMEYHESKRELSVQFRNMQLKKIKRADKKGTEAVTEEKFCILFQSSFPLGNGEFQFQVWTLSLPVVVTVHGNQECNALATVLWDNQFAEPGRTPFQVPNQVSWPAMGRLLDTKFASVTGRGLSHDNLNYLASKVFNGKSTDDYSTHMINWALFNKDTLPGRNFTFWEWFYAVMRLTKEHLKNLWCDETIIGFISKQQAQEWLMNKPQGTFLCRFSDSELGGVTIAWTAEDHSKSPGDKQVWNLAPYGTKEINIRTLADRIKDLPQLILLYPDIPKEKAFSKYYSSDSTQNLQPIDGYIRTHLINTIATPGAPMSFDNPQTPQAYHCPDSPASVSSVYSGMSSVMTPGGGNVSSTNTVGMDLMTVNEDELLDIFPTSLDYSADSLENTMMDILQNNA